jgi:hypothetical protein
MYDKILDPIAAIEKMGQWLAESGLAGTRNEGAGKVIAMKALFSRQNPLDIAAKYHVIDGKLSMRADAILAEFERAGGSWEWTQFDCEACTAQWTYRGKTTEIGFTKDDAVRAGLWGMKGNWTARPDAMLRARCISKAVRMIAPSVCFGTYTPEEIEDEKYVEARLVPNPEPLLPPKNPEVLPTEKTPLTDDEIDADLASRFVGINAFVTAYCNGDGRMPCDDWTELDAAKKRLIHERIESFIGRVESFKKKAEEDAAKK